MTLTFCSAIGANTVKHCLVWAQCKTVVGEEMVFEIVDEAAIHTHGLFTFRTF